MAQQMPKFNGDLPTYFSEHFTYPEAAKMSGTHGTVDVGFVVEKDGSLSGIHVIKSVQHSLDSAAVAFVSAMPKWIPGMQNGEKVRARYDIPVQFSLPIIDSNSVNPSTPPRIK